MVCEKIEAHISITACLIDCIHFCIKLVICLLDFHIESFLF